MDNLLKAELLRRARREIFIPIFKINAAAPELYKTAHKRTQSRIKVIPDPIYICRHKARDAPNCLY